MKGGLLNYPMEGGLLMPPSKEASSHQPSSLHPPKRPPTCIPWKEASTHPSPIATLPRKEEDHPGGFLGLLTPPALPITPKDKSKLGTAGPAREAVEVAAQTSRAKWQQAATVSSKQAETNSKQQAAR